MHLQFHSITNMSNNAFSTTYTKSNLCADTYTLTCTCYIYLYIYMYIYTHTHRGQPLNEMNALLSLHGYLDIYIYILKSNNK